MKIRNLRLQTKLTLLFALVAIVPLTVTALMTSSAVTKEFRDPDTGIVVEDVRELGEPPEWLRRRFDEKGVKVKNSRRP